MMYSPDIDIASFNHLTADCYKTGCIDRKFLVNVDIHKKLSVVAVA